MRLRWWEDYGGIVALVVLYVSVPLLVGLLARASPPRQVAHSVGLLLIANTVRTWRVLTRHDGTTPRLPALLKTWLIPGYCLVPTQPVTARYWVLVAIGVPLVLATIWFWEPDDSGFVRPLPKHIDLRRPVEQ